MTQSQRAPHHHSERSARRRRARSRGAVGLLLAGGLALGLALPASAASAPAGRPGPWQPYRSSPFSSPAGASCAFPLTGVPVADREKIRTLAVDGSGKPTEQEITGQLVFRYTDQANGRSADENLTGTAWMYHHADGSQTWVISGHFGMGIHPGNPYASPGYWILSGRMTIQIDAGHHPYLAAHDGPTQDLCAELG